LLKNSIEVSVLLPVRNEEKYVAACLDSILANDFGQDRIEILVLDGLSSDRTRAIVQSYSERYPNMRLIDNPGRIVSTGLNIGLRAGCGEIIVRMDGHVTYASDYIRQCVELLETTDAINVGGIQKADGDTYITKAIAMATSCPFGVGDAHWHYATESRWVDTVYLGAWRKQSLVEVGGFNEECVVNEDYELNYRLRKAGGRILLSPRIRCTYFVRNSVPALGRQYFRYGMWRVNTWLFHPGSLRWRQLVPPSFVMALILSGVALYFGFGLMAWFVSAAYASANISVSSVLAARQGWRYLPAMAMVFLVLHLAWGLGFLVGLGRFGVRFLSVSKLWASFRERA